MFEIYSPYLLKLNVSVESCTAVRPEGENGDSKDCRNVDKSFYIYMVPLSRNQIHISTDPL